jgi:hypothetical protein
MYGEGPIVTRLEGVGAGENFLEMDTAEYDQILSGNNNGEVTYTAGGSPIRVQVFNPLVVQDGEYILEFVDPSPSDTLSASTGWKFYNVNTPDQVYEPEKFLANLNEQLIADLGISVFIDSQMMRVTRGMIPMVPLAIQWTIKTLLNQSGSNFSEMTLRESRSLILCKQNCRNILISFSIRNVLFQLLPHGCHISWLIFHPTSPQKILQDGRLPQVG